MQPFRRNMTVAVSFGALGATAQWATDVLTTALSEAAPPAGGLLSGALAGLFLSLLAGLGVGLGLGLVWAVSLGPRRGDEVGGEALRAAWRWLMVGAPREHHLRAGGVVGALCLLAVVGRASFIVTRELVVEWAQPNFIALAVFGVHLVLATLALLLLPFARGVIAALLGLLSRIPGVRIVVDRAAGPIGLLAAAFVTVTVALIVSYRWLLFYLPWEATLRTLLAVVLGGVATLLLRRALERALWRRVGAGLVVALLAVSGVRAITLSPQEQGAREMLGEHLLASRLALTLLRPILDMDRDGYLSMFGGGDCRPFDPNVHPGAIDVPHDGIDQDCADGDLDIDTLDLWGKWRYPVDGHIPKDLPIVLVTIDTLAARHTSLLGYHRLTTPNLRRFARNAVLFENTFTQGPSTRLSFPAMFTSRWDSQIARRLEGKHPYPLEPSNLMLAEVLRDAGYDTAAVLPASYFKTSRWKGLTQGFNRVVEGPALAWGATNDHTADRVTDAALNLLKQERKKPLFLWAHYFDAHSPHVPPSDVKAFGQLEEDIYDAELAHTDRQVGRLLDGIEKAYDGDVLIIVTGDHGIGFDLPRHEKRHYGQDISTVSLHVPMIVRAPFVRPRRVKGTVTTLDIVPTIVNLLGLRGPFPFEGVSLVPELIDGRDSRPAVTFHQFYIHESLWKGNDPLRQISVRDGQWDFILDRTTGEAWLYDWQWDYHERQNLLEERPDIAREMQRTLMVYLYLIYGKKLDRAHGVEPAALGSGALLELAKPPPPPVPMLPALRRQIQPPRPAIPPERRRRK